MRCVVGYLNVEQEEVLGSIHMVVTKFRALDLFSGTLTL